MNLNMYSIYLLEVNYNDIDYDNNEYELNGVSYQKLYEIDINIIILIEYRRNQIGQDKIT